MVNLYEDIDIGQDILTLDIPWTFYNKYTIHEFKNPCCLTLVYHAIINLDS
jgi:hypothetical protein